MSDEVSGSAGASDFLRVTSCPWWFKPLRPLASGAEACYGNCTLTAAPKRLRHLKPSRLSFSPHPPKRTNTEPSEHECESDCYPNMTGSRLPCTIFHIFPKDGRSAENCQDQENKASNFEPKLVENASEMACSGSDSAQKGAASASASGVLGSSPRHRADLPGVREVNHRHRF
jgi:hypothetical protein